MWASLLSPFPQSLGGKDWRSGRWYCWSYEAEDIGEGSQEADGPGGALKCVLEVEDGWVWAGAHGKVAWREPWAFRGRGSVHGGEWRMLAHVWGFLIAVTS